MSVHISLNTLGADVLGLVYAELPQTDAIGLSRISKAFQNTYPHSVHCGTHQDLEAFLRWVSVRDIETITVTVNPADWNRLAPSFLHARKFKMVELFPGTRDPVYAAEPSVWIPAADEVRSGFFDDTVAVCEIKPWTRKSRMVSVIAFSNAQNCSVEMPYFSKDIAAFEFNSGPTVSMRNTSRIPPGIDFYTDAALTDDDVRHFATFTKMVHLSNVKRTKAHVFAAEILKLPLDSVDIVEHAPACTTLHLWLAGNTEKLQWITQARFPKLHAVFLHGYAYDKTVYQATGNLFKHIFHMTYDFTITTPM